MDDVRRAVLAVADSLLEHTKQKDSSKYGPIASQESDFRELVKKGEYEDVKIGDLPAGQYGSIREINGVNHLVFDTDNIPEEVLLENSELFLESHESRDGFAMEDRGGIAKATKAGDDLVDNIFNRYRDRMPRRLLPVLEDALVLRVTDQNQNLSRGTVYDWRGEIADNHKNRGHDPQEAHHLISLCSIGYFDENNVFDDMYSDLVENGVKTKEDYKKILGKYVNKNPFAVFVRASGMTKEEICALTVNKTNSIGKFPGSPGFVDICGKGEGTHDIIEESYRELKEEYDAEMREMRNPELEQYLVRVSARSI